METTSNVVMTSGGWAYEMENKNIKICTLNIKILLSLLKDMLLLLRTCLWCDSIRSLLQLEQAAVTPLWNNT